MRKHFVRFFSPGTFLCETSIKPIDTWDIVKAVKLAESIEERYSAKPFGFKFVTMLTAEPVSDGEGGTLAVTPREVAQSGMYFITGTLRMFDDIVKENKKEETILCDNMWCNDSFVIIENRRSFLHIGEFAEDACIVDESGRIIRRGNDPDLVAYRKKMAEKKANKPVYEQQTRGR